MAPRSPGRHRFLFLAAEPPTRRAVEPPSRRAAEPPSRRAAEPPPYRPSARRNPRLLPWRTVEQNIALVAPENADIVDELLCVTGLEDSRHAYPERLSVGMARRVALARLLLQPAKPLWLLDEPYDALDVDGCALIDELLAAHVRRGGGVMLTSHLPLTIRQPEPVTFMLEGNA